jgi:glycerophosphoryl diester phosphodiesterase
MSTLGSMTSPRHHLSRLAGLTLALALSATAALAGPSVAAAPYTDPTAGVQPLERAHAHNDYEHDRPLLDALEHGFTSVEADVYLVDGQLLVAHDPEDLDPTRTLQSLYLDPLRRIAHRNGGSVYRKWDGSIQLLIDIKNTGAETYAAIDRLLRRYPDIMTRWTGDRMHERAVTAVISGDRPRELMESQRTRFAGYDGRLSDLGTGISPTFMPLVSDNWTRHFTWLGVGPMPEAEREKLHRIVQQAHAAGYRVRFWATPDLDTAAREALWAELIAAGVDHLNTDDLAGLQEFLLSEDPAEQAA